MFAFLAYILTVAVIITGTGIWLESLHERGGPPIDFATLSHSPPPLDGVPFDARPRTATNHHQPRAGS
jgi:hypothetical protein